MTSSIIMAIFLVSISAISLSASVMPTDEVVDIVDRSGRIGLGVIVLVGLVTVWRKLEKIEQKREADWKARDKTLYDSVRRVTDDLNSLVKHHDDFAKLVQEERRVNAAFNEESRNREERQFMTLEKLFNFVINSQKEWQQILLTIHKESKATLQANTAVGRALIMTLRARKELPAEVTAHDAEFEERPIN